MLLLNRVLTVAPGQSGSHRGKGWEAGHRPGDPGPGRPASTPLVAILWGRDAQTLRPLLGDVPDRERAPEPAVGRPRLLRLPPVQPRQPSSRLGADPVDWSLP